MNSMYKTLLVVLCLLVCSIHAKNEIEAKNTYETLYDKYYEKYYDEYYEHYYEHYYENMGKYTCPVLKAYGYNIGKHKTCNIAPAYNATKDTVIVDEYVHPEFIIFQYAVIPPHIIDFVTQMIYSAIFTIVKSILVCGSLLTFIISLGLYIR
jgi:hypothetical protein